MREREREQEKVRVWDLGIDGFVNFWNREWGIGSRLETGEK